MQDHGQTRDVSKLSTWGSRTSHVSTSLHIHFHCFHNRYLAEQKEVELNIRDRWDSTPLYYACLCGHLDLVKYLLSRGAVCDASTFDGERCVYGALTNEIRKLLLEHKMLTPATMRREAYTEFLRSLFAHDQFKDVTFHIQGESVSAHKCILSARSSFLKQQFEERWRGRRHVNLSHKLVSFPAFSNLLEWLYTGQVHPSIIELPLTKLPSYLIVLGEG